MKKIILFLLCVIIHLIPQPLFAQTGDLQSSPPISKNIIEDKPLINEPAVLAEDLQKEITELLSRALQEKSLQHYEDAFELARKGFNLCLNIEDNFCFSVFTEAASQGASLLSALSTGGLLFSEKTLQYALEHIEMVEQAGGLAKILEALKDSELKEVIEPMMEYTYTTGYYFAGLNHAFYGNNTEAYSCLDTLQKWAPKGSQVIEEVLEKYVKLSSDEDLKSLYTVLVQDGLDPIDSFTIVEYLTPLFRKFNFKDVEDPREVLSELKKNIHIFTEDILDKKGKIIKLKHFELLSYILGQETLNVWEDFFSKDREGLGRYRSLFECNYSSYLAWIILRAKGVNTQGVFTKDIMSIYKKKLSLWERAGVSLGWMKIEDLRDMRVYHVSTIIHFKNGQSVFVDFINGLMGKPFSLQDNCFSRDGEFFQCMHNSDDYLFKNFELWNSAEIKAGLYHNLGILCSNIGQYEESLAYQEKALMLKPDYSPAYSNIGHIYSQRKQFDTAQEYYQKSIELDPLNSYGYSGLGKIAVSLQQYQNALEYLKKAVELDPHNVNAIASLGFAYTFLRDNNQAKVHLKRAIFLYEKEGFVSEANDLRKLLKNL